MVALRIFFVFILLWATSVRAEHDVKTPIIDGSAYLLNADEWRVGLFNLDYGIQDWLEIGTVPILMPFKIYSITTKVRVYQTGNHQVALRLGYFQLDARSFDEENPDAVLYCIPGELSWSFRSEASTWSVNVLVSRTGVRGDGESSDDLELSGAVLATSGILRPVYEYRVSKTGAWIIDAHLSLFQRIDGEVNSRVVVDERTTLEVHGSGEATFTSGLMANASASYQWSWEHFNLKLGLRYGTVSLPVANFFIPGQATWFPIVDMYWRF